MQNGRRFKIKDYFWNLLVAVDQLFNTILGGDPDETISSRIGKAKRRGEKWAIWFTKVGNIVLGKNHFIKSIEEDEGRKD